PLIPSRSADPSFTFLARGQPIASRDRPRVSRDLTLPSVLRAFPNKKPRRRLTARGGQPWQTRCSLLERPRDDGQLLTTRVRNTSTCSLRCSTFVCRSRPATKC